MVGNPEHVTIITWTIGLVLTGSGMVLTLGGFLLRGKADVAQVCALSKAMSEVKENCIKEQDFKVEIIGRLSKVEERLEVNGERLESVERKLDGYNGGIVKAIEKFQFDIRKQLQENHESLLTRGMED
jgi:hypothetical protein